MSFLCGNAEIGDIDRSRSIYTWSHCLPGKIVQPQFCLVSFLLFWALLMNYPVASIWATSLRSSIKWAIIKPILIKKLSNLVSHTINILTVSLREHSSQNQQVSLLAIAGSYLCSFPAEEKKQTPDCKAGTGYDHTSSKTKRGCFLRVY